MDRTQIVGILNFMADLLDLESDNPFRSRSYRSGARALEALTVFPEDETAAFLESFSQRTEPALARRGVEALSRGFGQTHPQHVQRTAAALSRHTNPQVRLSAGRALKDTAPEQLQRLMRTEPEGWVREALKQKE